MIPFLLVGAVSPGAKNPVSPIEQRIVVSRFALVTKQTSLMAASNCCGCVGGIAVLCAAGAMCGIPWSIKRGLNVVVETVIGAYT
jgi:hypothetical protein